MVFLYSLFAFLALIPATAVAMRSTGAQPTSWLGLVVAGAGAVAWTIALFQDGWQATLAPALWLIIAATLVVYVAIAAVDATVRRFDILVLPYVVALATLAFLASGTIDRSEGMQIGSSWIVLHIILSVLTYAISSVAACAGIGGMIQERALKRRSSGTLVRSLPSLAACEHIQFRLLTIALIVLGGGLATGLLVTYQQTGLLWVSDHKSLFSIGAFALISILLILQAWTGVRGRRATRVVLAAFLFLTLAYPGVKFVRDVLIG